MRVIRPIVLQWMLIWAISWALVGSIAWALFAALAWLLLVLGVTPAQAQGLSGSTIPPTWEKMANQTANSPPAAVGTEVNASGVFLNSAGDVLTAKHAVTGCRALYVVKDARVAGAFVLASSQDLDIAVLRTPLKPYLSATFAQTPPASNASRGVFAESYSALQRLPDRAALLSNALTVPGSDGLQLLSGAQPGASGSGVLTGTGLLMGMVIERVGAAPHATGRVLSRGPAGPSGGATQVRALTSAQIKRFLSDNLIPFTESDVAQLGPMQSPAARASTLSVGVLCG